MYVLLIVVLALLLVGAFPAWPYATRWGYSPTAVLLVLLVLWLLFGRRL